MFSALLLLTAAVPPPAITPAVRADIQCIALFAALSGRKELEASKAQTGLGLMYYLGKVDVAAPGLDLGKVLTEEMATIGTSDQQQIASRCVKEFEVTGQRLIEAGKRMGALNK